MSRIYACLLCGDHREQDLARCRNGSLTYWLARELSRRLGWGARNYAAEELVAALGAAFLSAEFSFDGDVRNAGYIATWIDLLKTDKRAFFTACSKASKAADYLRGLALAESQTVAA